MDIKLSVVVSVHNQFEIARQSIKFLIENMDRPEQVQLIVLDNGSKEHFDNYLTGNEEMYALLKTLGEAIYHRENENKGCYPYIFEQGWELAKAPYIAYFHSDLFVYQKGWEQSVLAHMDGNPNMGLLGFIGSTQIDNHGGRGLGTHSNMQGKFTPRENGAGWQGSAGYIHGKQDAGFIIDGAVVDGCVMIFRKDTLAQIGFRKEYPIHHFYDRLMSLQVLEEGQKVGILGVEFDHISGQTVNQEQGYQDIAKAWFRLKFNIDTPQEWAELPGRKEWVNDPMKNNPSHKKVPDQYDHATYLEAEYLFLTEYRDSKHIIPVNC